MNTIKTILAFSFICFASFAFSQTLSNGQTITINGGGGSSQYFSVSVPTNASNLSIDISGGSGDADLYVRYNATPTTSNYNCRPYLWGNNESCAFGSPNTGNYQIMVYAYSAFSNVSLSASYSVSGGSNPPSEDTIDIVTYNIEWLGNPSTAGYPGSRDQQIEDAADDIIFGEGEIYALQEIGGSSALNDLINQLNANDNINNWSGSVSQPTASQSLAYVYKTSIVNSASFQTILTNESSYDFAGRYPYLMNASITVGGNTRQLNLINLHLKCCTGTTNADRRAGAMASVVSALRSNYRTDNVIVLGDLNVAEEGGAYGEISDWGIYSDGDSDGQADYSHAAGSLTDEPYVSSNPDSDIDHILISNELRAAWDVVPANERNEYLLTTVSDHSPVKTTLDVALIGSSPGTSPTPTPSPAPSGISVSQALSQSVGTSVTVVGVITESFNGIYALRMRDINNASQTIVVKLESSQRSTWSPSLNPSVVGKTIQVVGRRDTYSSEPSIEYVTSIQE